ncbi:MAG: alpha-amylase/4-alpha-glucanotransferase domain-containing protein [Chloroflexota bacterium]
MAPRISLALAIHNHQPVGNFGWVFADVYEQAYRPMVDALDRHPGVRLALHYTGPLLDWLRAERPEFLARLRALVDCGQVELLGGGYYEPVLASLPERDRVGQLVKMADEVERIVGLRPRGAWLAERVWEPDLPTSLVTAGYGWTIVDDNHFRAAAIPEDRHWGPYTTDDQGHLLTVFGTEKGLRYRIPFGEVDDLIAYLRDHATEEGDRVGTMGDDGEKFGSWPTTWEHCWGATRWVDRFFDALEANAGWLTTITPSDWLAGNAPIGRAYLPTASYAEMGEWSLPPDESRVFADLLHRAEAAGSPEYRYLRGGFWRNFQVKYREINDLHKQMLRTSTKVATMPEGPVRTAALDHLYQGQSNDCYWHGLFGGIYISHMRLATYEHLIAAEDVADQAARAAGATVDGVRVEDIDLDGVPEVVIATAGQVVAVKPSEGAGIGSWDVRAVRHALAAVLRRRPEASHQTLVAHERRLAEQGGASAPAGGVGSIHDRVSMKEPGLADRLHYDRYERRSGLVHLLAPATTPGAFARADATEYGDFVAHPFRVEATGDDHGGGWARLVRDGVACTPAGALPVRVEKTIAAGGDRRTPTLSLEVRVENRGAGPLEVTLAVEWATTMLGGGGNPAAWYLLDGERIRHDAAAVRADLGELRSGNDYVGLEIATRVEPPAETWISPIDTVSNSEAGFERVYQGSALVFAWPLVLPAGAATTVRVEHTVTTARDRATEEIPQGPR